ncbi:MAG: PTS sugar transporter subunit IIC [Ruminococcaceae bacterium]|nr:PTS sugar transporter subunit IIC [Oscillospiraceae bacterium]
MQKVKAFLDRKLVKPSAKLYFVDAMGSMALGLFATLLIGTIFKTIGQELGWSMFLDIAGFATQATGAALGVAIALKLQAPPLVMLSSAVAGMIGNNLGTVIDGTPVTAGPAGAFVVVIIAVELGKLVSKETHVDILVTPVVTILSAMLVGQLVCPGIAYCMHWLGVFINTATAMQPLVMGILIAVVVGIILTLPISSAAICAMIAISGLAGGAATAGCCAQMVGFAVISFRENRWAGLVAQGLGTSMLQMGNIVRNPRIWIPATLASAITGPMATLLFKLECSGVNAGMGTCGLVGPLGVLSDMQFSLTSIIGVVVVCLVAPAILSLIFSEILRKLGWIKPGDMKLEL